MDIAYLLVLQNFRNGIHDALTPFLEWISLFGITYIMLLPVFVYWCLDKRKGLFIFAALKISQTFNAIVKLTACVYRPWIRDARIMPAGDAIRTATGYSFPSGHTMMVTPIYGGLACITKNKISRLFWAVLILLTMFSRNYLGVHTPQDVLVGLVLGIFALYITNWLLNHVKWERVMIFCAVLGTLTLIYITYKSYPMDYVDGKLLVDPVKMTSDAWGDAGGLVSFALAWYIENRFVKFTPTGWNVRGVVLCALGLLPLCWIISSFSGIMTGLLGSHLGKLAQQTVLYFYVMIIWPLVLKIFSERK